MSLWQGSRPSSQSSSDTVASNNWILLVDDNDSHRTTLKDFLELQGYSCIEAPNGIAALEVLRKTPISLIITDNHMPEMGGMEFIEHVNTEFSHETFPIVLLTAELSHEVRLQAFKNGVNRVFEKPVDFREICTAVDWVTKFGVPLPEHLRPSS